jgi:hypothetical protein
MWLFNHVDFLLWDVCCCCCCCLHSNGFILVFGKKWITSVILLGSSEIMSIRGWAASPKRCSLQQMLGRFQKTGQQEEGTQCHPSVRSQNAPPVRSQNAPPGSTKKYLLTQSYCTLHIITTSRPPPDGIIIPREFVGETRQSTHPFRTQICNS